MKLSRENLTHIKSENYVLPPEHIRDLPEKVLQFGTGVLLRGLPDYFIDKANRQGIFNGRIVVVKSTAAGSTSAFDQQQGLYTLHVRGIENGNKTEENIVCSAISRVLSASEQWKDILECAYNPEMKIIISNTTEVGIVLADDDITVGPPSSFPGKLLAFLYERFKAFNGSAESGMVIVPTELIVDNGSKLKAIVKELAIRNNFETSFLAWLQDNNCFCDSLVDRIVPGKPDEQTLQVLETESGYEDDLRIISEVYCLWAIQGNKSIADILSFSRADSGVIITEDIEVFRELKLRLLNGTHTLSCGIAFLSGFETVKEAMDDKTMSSYITGLMISEISPAIPYQIPAEDSKEFALKVLDRFRNPHIKHLWHSITLSYSAKLKMRVLPVLLQYYKIFNTVPENIALGFAAYIKFMNISGKDGDKYFGKNNQKIYYVNDDKAERFYQKYSNYTSLQLVEAVLGDTTLWDIDLRQLPGFAAAVTEDLDAITELGMSAVLERKISV